MSTTSVAPAARRRLPDWGAPDPVYPRRNRTALLALVTLPALLVALVIGVLTGLAWLAALLAGAWVLKTCGDAFARDPLMLRMLRARRIDPGEAPRLQNVARGLAGDLGVPPPHLYLIPDGGANALVRKGGRGGVIAVTSSLLEHFTRTELEAVIAHCLARLHSAYFVYSNLAARWTDLGAGLAPRVGTSDDVRAAALTRYPPALVAALQKSDPRIKRYAPLWFVADAPSHDPIDVRVAAISEL
ncbi:MAG: M48 family metalloprotease [Actinomycetota bacterium]|nr:M48 family metalloprotease [Actinomycetota bacterium]